MPARQRARRVTVREVLDTAIELEKKTMALYVTFVKAFPRPEEVRNFWFGMARHEAGHCGALALVESIIQTDPERGETSKVWLDDATVSRLRSLLTAYQREVKTGLPSTPSASESVRGSSCSMPPRCATWMTASTPSASTSFAETVFFECASACSSKSGPS